MRVDVRPADRVDIAVLVPLADQARRSVRTERGGAALLADLGLDGGVADALTTAIEDPRAMLWCAEIDGVAIGYLSASLDGDGDGRVAVVRELWVEPEARGVGAGEELVTAAIAWAIAEEAVAIDAHALPGSRETKNLFERFGLTARLVTVRRALR